MIGELWQECYCGSEPVCAHCEKCKKHCICGQPKREIIRPPPIEPYRKGIGQGFGSTEDGQPNEDG